MNAAMANLIWIAISLIAISGAAAIGFKMGEQDKDSTCRSAFELGWEMGRHEGRKVGHEEALRARPAGDLTQPREVTMPEDAQVTAIDFRQDEERQ